MIRLAIIVAIAIGVFTIYSFIDVVTYPRSRVRALPKGAWAVIVLIPALGGILWQTLGKQRASGRSAQGRTQRAPDDDPEFLQRLGQDKDRDARIQELEARLAELDDDHDDPKK